MGFNKNKMKLLGKGKLSVEEYPHSVTVVIIVLLLDLLAWKDLGFVISLEKKASWETIKLCHVMLRQYIQTEQKIH